jgi:hypothetical protein
MKLAVQVACIGVAVLSTSALAGPWSTPAGTQPTFDYSGGSDLNGHFGDGYGLANGFEFFPSNFSASASNNDDSQTGDTLSVILNAKPGNVFTKVTGGMLGDLSGLGVTNFGGMGQLRVINLDDSTTLWTNLSYDVLPLDNASSVASNWAGSSLLNIPGWTNIKIEMDGLVSAYADNESTAFIEAKGASVGVETAAIPLPPAMLAAIPAAMIAYRARRKMSRR